MEIYREYGMKFQEAQAELAGHLADTSTADGQRQHEAAQAPSNEQSLVMLQAMMGGTDFGGPKG